MFVWFLCVGDKVVLKCGGFEHMFLVDSSRFMFVWVGWSTWGTVSSRVQLVTSTSRENRQHVVVVSIRKYGIHFSNVGKLLNNSKRLESLDKRWYKAYTSGCVYQWRNIRHYRSARWFGRDETHPLCFVVKLFDSISRQSSCSETGLSSALPSSNHRGLIIDVLFARRSYCLATAATT